MPHDKASGAKPADVCAMVIFGAAGDLTKRLIVPALYNLACAKLLPKNSPLSAWISRPIPMKPGINRSLL